MIIDGKALASECQEVIKKEIKTLGFGPKLAIFLVGDNPMSIKYTQSKKKLSEVVGAQVTIYQLATESLTENIVDQINLAAADETIQGIIVQLPLPETVDRNSVLAAIPPEKDVDALSGKSAVLSPVVEAIKYILLKSNLADFTNKKIVVVGRGNLVGLPVAAWIHSQPEVDLHVVDIQTPADLRKQLLAEADYVISGAGVPGLITPADIKEGVVLIDASTTDVNGNTVGDIDSACADKAALYTPVPGGVGPLTVVMLFQNLVTLAKKP